MTISDKIKVWRGRIEASLAAANGVIERKGGTAAGDVSGLADAIDTIPEAEGSNALIEELKAESDIALPANVPLGMKFIGQRWDENTGKYVVAKEILEGTADMYRTKKFELDDLSLSTYNIILEASLPNGIYISGCYVEIPLYTGDTDIVPHKEAQTLSVGGKYCKSDITVNAAESDIKKCGTVTLTGMKTQLTVPREAALTHKVIVVKRTADAFEPSETTEHRMIVNRVVIDTSPRVTDQIPCVLKGYMNVDGKAVSVCLPCFLTASSSSTSLILGGGGVIGLRTVNNSMAAVNITCEYSGTYEVYAI